MGNWETPALSQVIMYLNQDDYNTARAKIIRSLNSGHWFKSVEKSHWCNEINEMVHDRAWGHYRILIFSEETRSDVKYIFDQWEIYQVYEKLQPCDDNNPSVMGICPCGMQT